MMIIKYTFGFPCSCYGEPHCREEPHPRERRYRLKFSWEQRICAPLIWPKFFSLTGLHYMSFLEIVEVGASLAEMEACNLNQANFTGSTPDDGVAYHRPEKAGKLLHSGEDVNPNKRSNRGWAARNGYNAGWKYHSCGMLQRGQPTVGKILPGQEDVTPANRITLT